MMNKNVKKKRIGTQLVGAVTALTLFAAACGNNDGSETAVAPAGDTEQLAAPAEPTTDEAAPAASALLGSNTLGEVMVGSDGRTLYGFTNDTEAKSTCYGGCAEAWPPVIVGADWAIGPGLDLGIFATTERDDGQLQLVAGKWPLYFYAGDAVPGDINGQGSGDVWFAVNTDGSLVLDTAAAPQQEQEAAEASVAVVDTGDTDLGSVLIDADGLTLYGFTNDVDGVPSCEDGCAEAWPPVIVDALPADLDPSTFSVIERADGGGLQLVAGKWPLYRFAGDAAAGDINGQGSGGVWFAAAPDGSLIGATDSSAQETADTSEAEDADDGNDY